MSVLCIHIQEVELHEASYYGLMQRVPDLLTTISADAAGYVSFRQMIIQHVDCKAWNVEWNVEWNMEWNVE